MFNPKKTFTTFVMGYKGIENAFAYSAAFAVAQNPGPGYNPLLIYGGTGVGKTHLLHAIGQCVCLRNKAAQVTFLSAEQLMSEYIDAVQKVRIGQFREKHLRTDVLLIDDIQFLVGKERLQEELYHALLRLHGAQKQIVMAGNLSPSELEELEQRLVSRFEWSLVATMQRTAKETVRLERL